MDSDNPVHRLGAMGIRRLLNTLPNLQSNNGSLMMLVSLALAFVLLLAWSSRGCGGPRWRRRRAGVAASLRRQIHRQMYRLGQSSLPTEGTGPVVNLFTREVNDVRDGLIAQLDVGSRMPMLAVGLACFLLMVSWTVDPLPRRAGHAGLAGASRALKQSSDGSLATSADREAAVQLSALAGRPEPAADRPGPRDGERRQVAVRRAPRPLHRGRHPPDRRRGARRLGPVPPLRGGGGRCAGRAELMGWWSTSMSPASAAFLIASLAAWRCRSVEWLRMRKLGRAAGGPVGGGDLRVSRTLPRTCSRPAGRSSCRRSRSRIAFENVTLENSRRAASCSTA